MFEIIIQFVVALGVWFIAYLFLGKELRHRMVSRPRLTVNPRSVVDAAGVETLKPLTVVSHDHFEVFVNTIHERTVTYNNPDHNEVFFVLSGEARARIYNAVTNELVVDKVMRATGMTASEPSDNIVAHSLEGQYIVITGLSQNTRILCLVVPPYSEMLQIVGTVEGGVAS